jgi:hypothetical protein
VVSIGKLHVRGRPGDDHGFRRKSSDAHHRCIGDVKGLIRGASHAQGGDKMARRPGPANLPARDERPHHPSSTTMPAPSTTIRISFGGRRKAAIP